MNSPLTRRIVMRETLLALLVLGLVFLNFGHAGLSLGSEYRAVPDAWCGDPLLPDTLEHAPCHACRIGSGADLPAAPGGVEPVVFAVAAVAYAAPSLSGATLPLLFSAKPRGPPAA